MDHPDAPPVDTATAASPRPPLLSLVFGYGPALLLVALAATAWAAPPAWRELAAEAALVWGAAILIFLAGVRRGLSFFTEGGPQPAQFIGMLTLFTLGLAALVLALVLPGWTALAALALGYVDLALLDPYLARRGEAPRHFATLRPPQAGVFLLGVALLAVAALR